jgi:Ca-activated chloride channel family protein
MVQIETPPLSPDTILQIQTNAVKNPLLTAVDTARQQIIITQHSNKGYLTGKVVDATSGDPLIGANVIIEGTSIGAATDVNGEYKITWIPTGRYNIKVSYIGYNTQSITNVWLSSDSSKSINLSFAPATLAASEVVIMAQRPVIKYDVSTSVCAISSETIRNLPSANAATAKGILPGVSKSGGEIVRGMSPQFNTESYDKINENEFLEVLGNPLSTFSIDVDAASYSNVRRFINDGQMPPPGAVRIEELVNYFSYSYPDPAGEHPFSFTTEVTASPWNPEHNLLLIGIQGKRISTDALPPSNLVFLLDVSGSMDDPRKLPLVKAAFRLLVNQLRPVDRVAIVVYASASGVVLESTPGNDKQEILDAIDNLEAGGSTAGGAGIKLAYEIAKENFLKNGNNRVILATDGDFNVGASSDAEMVDLIEEERKEGIYLSVLGFGMGNLKDSKMEKLADKGNGNYAYIDNLLEAKKVFVGQMAGTLFTIAKDVKIQIEFNPMKVKAYRLIGYEDRLLAKEDFNNDQKDAGELGAGHTVTALYEIVPAGAAVSLPNVDSLKYQNVNVRSDSKTSAELLTLKFRYKPPKDTVSKLIVTVVEDPKDKKGTMSENMGFASAVAEWGMLLRDSKFKGTSTFEDVIKRARQYEGEDEEGYRSEFIRLVKLSKSLPKYSVK